MSSLVHFRGGFDEQDAHRIRRAVSAVEEGVAPGLPGESSILGCPWIATFHNTGATEVYTASRVGLPDVLSAESATALASKIRRSSTVGENRRPENGDARANESPSSL